ncbi:MAG: GNAT family N-acetyltransferase [Desulfobacula sp.]|jgi:ElaA protein
MTIIEWEIKPFDRLCIDELYDLLKLRVDVFVVEQNCAYAELDENDRHPDTLHLTGRNENRELVAYLRILPPGLSFEQPGIGRVVVSKKNRGQGFCRTLIQKAVDQIHRSWPGMGIKISAQAYLEAFYQSYGFKKVSGPYSEDGILHLEMLREDL